MKATLIALTALSLFMGALFLGATPVSARDYSWRDYSWRDYDCRRYNRLTASVGAIYHGRLYPGDVIKGYGWWHGWRRAPFI
jgi:hypothetical protein